MNCSNQELHVIHIILQINDPSSLPHPRKREDVPSRLLDSPGQSVMLGSGLGGDREAWLALLNQEQTS